MPVTAAPAEHLDSHNTCRRGVPPPPPPCTAARTLRFCAPPHLAEALLDRCLALNTVLLSLAYTVVKHSQMQAAALDCWQRPAATRTWPPPHAQSRGGAQAADIKRCPSEVGAPALDLPVCVARGLGPRVAANLTLAMRR